MAYKIKQKKFKVHYYIGNKSYRTEIEAKTKNQAYNKLREKKGYAEIVGIVEKKS
jgi:hypothetical protein